MGKAEEKTETLLNLDGSNPDSTHLLNIRSKLLIPSGIYQCLMDFTGRPTGGYIHRSKFYSCLQNFVRVLIEWYLSGTLFLFTSAWHRILADPCRASHVRHLF
jgi:hypothetical protein